MIHSKLYNLSFSLQNRNPNSIYKFFDCIEFARWMLGRDIKGSTVGIVGLGSIGEEIVKRLKGFKVGTILYTGHREKPAGANALLINRSLPFNLCSVNEFER